MKKRGILLLFLIGIVSVLLTGCFKGEQSMEEIDPPQNAEEVDNMEEANQTKKTKEDEKETDDEGKTETVARQLYLMDVNGMVAPQTLDLPIPDSKEVAKQVLEYLVKGGPVTSLLPNGFQAVLPEGTEILGLRLEKDGTMIVDVSEDFKNYKAEDETKILEAMTFTLTQFENVDRIKLWINGHPQSEMPVNGTPLTDGYSRANGINVLKTDTVDLINSKPVTMYYPAEHNENRYYVPMTQHVDVTGKDMYQAIVEAMLDGPGYTTNTVHVFNTEAELISEPVLSDGVLQLKFNQQILKDKDKAVISDEVIETIVRTLTEQQLVDAVDIKVDNIDKLVNENGEAYEEPVSKKSFIPSEKL
ncbi:GerMN domain-containing protein [Virgibacillus sp. LDC-1]|uniref:GerMN domain-containing protein n=1 Tax=Virgibacillus sp. LDC-1 TaxID=3039856 RepID=UPI0024DEC6F8|nr:GerMN domain-containing protein [Virgibacillus sp. LDC-1]